MPPACASMPPTALPASAESVMTNYGLQNMTDKVVGPGVKRNMRVGFNKVLNKELEAFHRLVLLS